MQGILMSRCEIYGVPTIKALIFILFSGSKNGEMAELLIKISDTIQEVELKTKITKLLCWHSWWSQR
jgi:hypothetical protein